MSLQLYMEIMRSLGIKEPDPPPGLGRVVEGLPSWFDVSGLAEASIAAAAVQVAAISDLGPQNINVDRRLCGLWFGWSLRPQGWVMPNPWDPIAGDYKARDGWIRLHTNAPHHRAAALRVLRTSEEKEAVIAAAAQWDADELEAAVVEAGGCAAAMRSLEAWAHHPQGQAIAAEALIDWSEAPILSTGRVALNPDRPLDGVRVLDLTRVLAGPVATRFLAAFGANVLRIDPPNWDEPGVIPEVTFGKRCAGLDLRDADDRSRFAELLRTADILVHGYRPGALEGLGFGKTERWQLNPGLIDVCLDAYGWTGPWARRRGFDSLVQMSTGIADAGMRIEGLEKPCPLRVQALDQATGGSRAFSPENHRQGAFRPTVAGAHCAPSGIYDILVEATHPGTRDKRRSGARDRADRLGRGTTHQVPGEHIRRCAGFPLTSLQTTLDFGIVVSCRAVQN